MDIPLIKPRVLSPSRVVNAKRALPKDMDDLIHLPGPLTEDAVMRTLQARFGDGKHYVSVIFFSLSQYIEVLEDFNFKASIWSYIDFSFYIINALAIIFLPSILITQ